MELDLAKLSVRPSRLINIIFVGHVDAGKSTICGRILVDLNIIDRRTLEKYREQSADMNRATWYLSWCMDLNPEEREKGKTTEVGTATFDLPHTRINVLDAPGHKQFISEMIDAASRADVGVLIVSARTSEFESGFRGGQTKEHLLLLKSAGVEQLVVLVNKMDECGWNNGRYEEIKQKIAKFVKQLFQNVHFIPISGRGGENVASRHCTALYDGPSFLEYLDTLELSRPEGSACVSIVEKIRTSGNTFFYVKCDSGRLSKNSVCRILPLGREVRMSAVHTEDDVEAAEMAAGENYKIRVDGCQEELNVGMKLVSPDNKDYAVCSELYAQLLVFDVNRALTVGYCPIMHVGLQSVGCKVVEIISMDKKKLRVARKGDKVVMRLKLDCPVVVACSDKKRDRFSLRDESLTVASGVIKKIK